MVGVAPSLPVSRRRLAQREALAADFMHYADDVLVERVLAGDCAAFEALMRRHNTRMFRIARSILRDDAEAEDAVQDAYLRAYVKLAQYERSSRFAGWLARIAVNEALARLRHRSRRAIERVEATASTESASVLPLTRQLDTPEDRMANDELRRLLEQSIDELPDAFRTVFVLREVEQLSIHETAACLDLLPQTVKTRLHRAKRMLRDAMTRMVQAEVHEAFPFAGARCDRIVRGVLARLPPVP